ncbi:MAG: SMC family ATPase [Candidatus Thermoplasmatota archaeon]|nr:SMC family ATPase [Euryarchaeota archaeon]MBU4033017.1 SMC family ATPase [Candidatus Thermoplasmatota archaeon]MBU4070633.1 SMC family ATPase [Candidatus Thermoplasmatota archaeon]MBU4145128.1 SMC family ATPase [Candidatus Thermoplasmatota archaeon]MBU4591578.1 SMC family ATPase [Candidatus Thermoplasmatota archaeon]
MRLRSIQLRNYRRYESVDLELPDGMISIVGPNGSGKSTLLEAFAWALFGNQTEIVRTGKESIKRQGAAHTDPCSVRIEFDFEDTGYIIERTMKGKNLTMNAEMYAGDTLMARGTEDVSEALIKLFGMDHKSFFISVFARQMELNALTSQPKGERKKIVLRLLDIESVDEAIKSIREDLRYAKATLDTAREELTTPEGGSAIEKLVTETEALEKTGKELRKTIKDLQGQLKKMESVQVKLKKDLANQEKMAREKNSLESAIKAQRNGLRILESQKKELSDDLEQMKEKEDELKAQEPKAGKLAKDLESLLEKKTAAREERDSVRSDMTNLKANIKQLAKEIRETEIEMKEITSMGPESDCPTCKRRLGETYEMLLENFGKQIEERRGKIIKLDEKHTGLEAKLGECNARSGALDKREENIRERISKFEKLKYEVRQAERLRKKLEEVEIKISKSMKDINEFQEKLAELAFDEGAYETSRKALESLSNDIRQMDRELMRQNTDMARKDEQAKSLVANLERLRKIEKKQAGQREHADSLTVLEKLMIDFRTHLISRIRPALMSISSELLGMLTDGKYSEIILDDDYEISIRDAGEPHKLERFSGGEKDLANLCLRLAISEIIATRHGTSSFDLIVLDEIFGSQDSNRKRTLLSTLNGLSNRFKQIFLITHVEDVKELMGNVIQVTEKANGTSSAEVIQ